MSLETTANVVCMYISPGTVRFDVEVLKETDCRAV
jgi:hypothetical protein